MNRLTHLGLGANVGDPLETLTAAVHVLDELDGLAVVDLSGVYRSPPWPPAGDPRSVPQEPYLNMVVVVATTLEPHRLLDELQLIEQAFGRDRDAEIRWGPRPLDIDILLMEDLVLDSPSLTVPHPRIPERTFVLVPLLEVFPGGSLPDGRRLTRLLMDLGPGQDIDLEVRLADVPGARGPRPPGPVGPRAGFRRPGSDGEASTHGADPPPAGGSSSDWDEGPRS